MESKEFYDYIVETFNLNGTSCRLISNIIKYVASQGFVDKEDAHAHLKSLLGGAFGISEYEIKLHRAPVCEECGEYSPYGLWECDNKMLCKDCEALWDISDEEELS